MCDVLAGMLRRDCDVVQLLQGLRFLMKRLLTIEGGQRTTFRILVHEDSSLWVRSVASFLNYSLSYEALSQRFSYQPMLAYCSLSPPSFLMGLFLFLTRVSQVRT